MSSIEFDAIGDYFRFAKRIRNERRYFRTPEDERFLQIIAETSKKRILTLPAGKTLWRAQIGHEWDEENYEPNPLREERMKPRAFGAREGRVNPKGIPYLYLSSNRATAMGEVRPWVGSLITVAGFHLKQDVRLIDCFRHRDKYVLKFEDEDCTAEEKEEGVWSDIDRAFSEPVTINDDTPDYIPTQVLGEFFRSLGYDGVAYKSVAGTGHNVALFTLGHVKYLGAFLHTVKSIKFEFEPDLPARSADADKNAPD